jgi:uncharacterized protein with PIN domain
MLVIDTSALVAIMLNEPGWRALSDRIRDEAPGERVMSAANYVELGTVIAGRRVSDPLGAIAVVRLVLSEAAIRIGSVEEALEKVAAEYPGQRVVVVTHNGVIKLAAQIVTGAPTEAVFHIDAAPCSITTISIWPSDGLRALRSLNETGHFRP